MAQVANAMEVKWAVFLAKAAARGKGDITSALFVLAIGVDKG